MRLIDKLRDVVEAAGHDDGTIDFACSSIKIDKTYHTATISEFRNGQLITMHFGDFPRSPKVSRVAVMPYAVIKELVANLAATSNTNRRRKSRQKKV